MIIIIRYQYFYIRNKYELVSKSLQWNPSTYTQNKDISANQIWNSFEFYDISRSFLRINEQLRDSSLLWMYLNETKNPILGKWSHDHFEFTKFRPFIEEVRKSKIALFIVVEQAEKTFEEL